MNTTRYCGQLSLCQMLDWPKIVSYFSCTASLYFIILVTKNVDTVLTAPTDNTSTLITEKKSTNLIIHYDPLAAYNHSVLNMLHTY